MEERAEVEKMGNGLTAQDGNLAATASQDSWASVKMARERMEKVVEKCISW